MGMSSICYNYIENHEAGMDFPIKPNLSDQLKQALSPLQNQLLLAVASEAIRQQMPLYVVGGLVRDLLLGHPVSDFDLVVEGDAVILARAIASRNGGTVRVHPRFKTAQWFPPNTTGNTKFIDLITARSERYNHPAALPSVRPGTLKDDLRRRDFTINTLALRADTDHFGDLVDELGGGKDLKAGLVRVLHPASFEDDPTRLFRAVRYEQRYGFTIELQTQGLIPGACAQVLLLSAQRVRHELELILEEENPAPMLKRLADLGILRAVHPDLDFTRSAQLRFERALANAGTMKNLSSRLTLCWFLWLMDVPSSGLRGIDRRLHFDARLRENLLAASDLFAEKESLPGKKTSECVALLDHIPDSAVQAVAMGLPPGKPRQVLIDYLATWRYVRSKTSGHDLKGRGLPPGPAYQAILRRLRDARLDGEVRTNEDELRLLEKLISEKNR
jgi:tRNA nucleotidyltransferase (CCA-adding enzyme)